MIDTARDRSAMTSSPSRRSTRYPARPEHSIAPRVGATAPAMIATIDFDYQRDSRSQEVDDVVPDDRLPAKRNPEPAAPQRLPQPCFSERGAQPHFASTDLELHAAGMGWTRQWTSERAGEVPGRSPPRAGSVTLADDQLSSARINVSSHVPARRAARSVRARRSPGTSPAHSEASGHPAASARASCARCSPLGHAYAMARNLVSPICAQHDATPRGRPSSTNVQRRVGRAQIWGRPCPLRARVGAALGCSRRDLSWSPH
jgi:hypothetical protein